MKSPYGYIENSLGSSGRMVRRAFLKLCASTALASWLMPSFSTAAESNGRPKKRIKGKYDLVVAAGEDPAALVRRAVEEMGGMGRFVKKGATVVVKPNMAWDRSPEQAGNTNPAIIAELVQMCVAAGAKRVNVFDRPCNEKKRCYDNSGIRTAAEEKGAKVFYVEDWMSVKAKFDYESPMQDWPVFREAVECDTFINVPILKHHGLTNLTISMKNLMGVCLGNRGDIHNDIGRKLVDITDFIGPDLTVVDAYRILTAHGPSGGSLDDVELRKTVIVGTDPTLADAYAADFFGMDPMEVPNIAEAASRKFGSADIKAAKIKRLSV
jgi:uncharacterized protein (DUF362 family)